MKYITFILLLVSNFCYGQFEIAMPIYTPCATPGAIQGNLTISGGGSTLTDATAGGDWYSTSTSVATIGLSSGIVTGVSTGTSTISYKISGGCYAVATVTVGCLTAPIAGNTTISVSAISQLTDATAGGTWTSSNTTVATIGTSGLVMGAATGTSTVSYTVGVCPPVTAIITVVNISFISGDGSVSTNTTSASITINTIGASFVIISNPNFVTASGKVAVPTDNQGNTFTRLTNQQIGQDSLIEYVCYNPITSASHTFSVTSSNILPSFPSIFVAAFSGISYSDTHAGNGSNAVTSIQGGSVTPSQVGALSVSTLLLDNIGSFPSIAINSGYTIVKAINPSPSAVGGAIAYHLGISSATNPTWTYPNAATMISINYIFH